MSAAADSKREGAGPMVGVLMGSESDWSTMLATAVILKDFGVAHECRVLSAHRTPDDACSYASTAEARGIEIIIAGAGLAAHLAGVLAAHTTIPVLGVPIDGGALKGMDALLATVQMPGGIPVGTFGIGKHGAKNAGLFAVSILASNRPELREKLHAFRKAQAAKVLKVELPEI